MQFSYETLVSGHFCGPSHSEAGPPVARWNAVCFVCTWVCGWVVDGCVYEFQLVLPSLSICITACDDEYLHAPKVRGWLRGCDQQPRCRRRSVGGQPVVPRDQAFHSKAEPFASTYPGRPVDLSRLPETTLFSHKPKGISKVMS